MSGPAPSGILLAAGAGRRFGGPKALVELQGELLVERGARLLAAGGSGEVVVVLGARADEVLGRAALGSARPVVNDDWAIGMGSSLVAGLASLGEGIPAAVVALVDQPLVGPEAVRRLIAAWRDGARAAVADYDGRPRNPVLFDRALWPQVAREVVGNRGARDFLRSHPELVTLVACGDTGAPDDVDTVEDLRAIAQGMRSCG